MNPDEPFGSVVAKGHPAAGSRGASAMEGAQALEQVLQLYGDYSYVTLRRIEWEWASGQWFTLLDGDSGLLGWVSWYRCNFQTLAWIRDRSIAGLVGLGSADDLLRSGEYLYIPTVVSASPLRTQGRRGRHVLFALLSAVRFLNPDARAIAWHSRRRDGQFQVFALHTGGEHNGV